MNDQPENEPIMLDFKRKPPVPAPGDLLIKVVCAADGRPDLIATLQALIEDWNGLAARTGIEAKQLQQGATTDIDIFGRFVSAATSAANLEHASQELAATVNAWRDSAIEWQKKQKANQS